MVKKPFIFILIALCILFCAACGSLENDIESVRAKDGLPALGVGIVKDGQIDRIIVTGTRAINSEELATENDRWHLGSLTKGMTATLAALLVKDGHIRYTSTIGEILGESKYQLDSQYFDRTLQELLNQTAALPQDESSIPSWETFRRDSSPLQPQRIRFLREYLSLESDGERGTFRYANGHYITAGAMLEAATGETWEHLMMKYLFEPLQMEIVGFGPPGRVGEYDEPKGHTLEEGSLIPLEPTPDWDNPKMIGPSGIVHASLKDYCKFILEHLNSFKGASILLPAADYKILHTPTAESVYAMGWEVMPTIKLMGAPAAEVLGDTLYMHGGSNGYWIAGCFLFPAIDMGVIIVSNAGGREIVESGQKALQKIMEHYYGSQILSKMATRKKLPSGSEYLFPTARNQGADAVIQLYFQVRDSLSDQYNFGPGELMYIGHYYSRDVSKHEDAIKIYQLEAEMFPKQGQGDYNTAKSYLALGDTADAVKYYRLSISKQPEFFTDTELEDQLGITGEKMD